VDYGREIQFGVFVIPATMNPTRALDVASIADEVGFDLIGVQDHPYQWRFFDTMTLLTAMAMRTHRISLFPDVVSLPMRSPAVLAKAAASIDVLSGGRFELGLGAGGFWEAIKAMGGSVRTPGESVSAVEEAIQVIRLLWSGQHGIKFEGKFYRLAGAHSGPLPAHPIGIWLGAYRPRMLSIIGRLADGWVPSLGYVKPPDLLEGNRRIDEAATAAGRDPRTIRRLLNAGQLEAEELVSLVVDYGMDTFLVTDDPDEMRRYAQEVIPRVREEVESRRSRKSD